MVAMRQASKADHELRIGANAWHHSDPLGTAGVITNGSAQVVSNNLYDLFGVLRYQQGSAQTPRRWRSTNLAEEWLVSLHGSFALPKVGLTAGGFLLRGIPRGVAICLI
ncbi:MAG: hypothetical protein KatS3mg023_1953 [Armatimonadota bacterium]|nr:MAG: hypothetical protein KatS3mg023_1953 [Armatimonadota bacterium]